MTGIEHSTMEFNMQTRHHWASAVLYPKLIEYIPPYVLQEEEEAVAFVHQFSAIDCIKQALKLSNDPACPDKGYIMKFLAKQFTKERIPDFTELKPLGEKLEAEEIQTLIAFWSWWWKHKSNIRQPWMLTFLLASARSLHIVI